MVFGMKPQAADLRKWLQQRRMAEAREHAERLNAAPDPVAALARGLALIAFASEVNPRATRAATLSPEDAEAYRRWAAIRNALRAA